MKNLLNIYFTAGYPALNDTANILLQLQESGADLVEIGIPYSDPIADGPTIQASNMQALENGMHLALLFEQLSAIKSEIKIPVYLMGYFNSVLQFGIEKFCQKCQENNITGAILPDLPLELYQLEYAALFEKYGINPVFLITPQTSEERILEIDKVCQGGFVYAVSSASTTGTKKGIEGAQSYLEKIKSLALKSTVLTGFNIANAEDYQFASRYTNGAIIGSAFIKAISNEKPLTESIPQFVASIKN